MTNRTLKIVAVVGLAGLMFTAWHMAQAKEGKPKGPALPSAAAAAVKKAFPKATITEVEVEREHGMKLYEVELTQDGKETEVEVSPDGVIVGVETQVAEKDLPNAVKKAIAKAAKGAKILKIEKEEVRAVVKLVELKTPRVIYEAELAKDGKKMELEISADGTILSKEADDDDDDD